MVDFFRVVGVAVFRVVGAVACAVSTTGVAGVGSTVTVGVGASSITTSSSRVGVVVVKVTLDSSVEVKPSAQGGASIIPNLTFLNILLLDAILITSLILVGASNARH